MDQGEDYYLNRRREVDITRAPERHRFWISKNDFWKPKTIYPNGHPVPIGGIDLRIPAALAGKLVDPDRQVIAVTGDGGFGMAINGILTAKDENIPIVTVILNNGALGWVKHGQGNRTIASTFADTNYADVANAMGVKGIRVEKPGEIGAAG